MAEAAITQGALRTIFERGQDAVPNPIMQCVQIKPLDSKVGDTPRYRVVLSDIHNFIQTMLASQISYLVTDGKLKKGSIVRLSSFQPQTVKDKKILILMNLDILEQYGELDKIGNPVQLDPPKSEPQEEKPQPAAISVNSFYGNGPAPQQQQPQQQQPQQQQPQQQDRSLPSHLGNSAHPTLYPIESLSPYAHKWTIKARCTHKGEIRTWHNKNGEGKLFSVNLLDETGEIRATGFNDQCDAFYEVFQEGYVYYISAPCRVNFAKKQFSQGINNDYELTFERDTLVEKAEDQVNVPQVRYNFISIGDLDSVEKDTTIDTIGVLKEVADVTEIISQRTSKPYAKRDLTLADSSLTSVRLTIWGNSATSFDTPLESVIAFKGVKVSDFGGRSLSLLSSGSMTVDPDIDEAHKLKGWYDADGRQAQYTSHANLGANADGGRKQEYKKIAQILDEELGLTEEAVFFGLKATVLFVMHESFCYPACKTEGCNKKVVEENPGEWRCEKCDKSWPQPQYRYVIKFNVTDHTGQIWLSGFDDTGRTIMGMSADQLMEIKEQDENNVTPIITDYFQDATCKTYEFRVKAKMETFQDQPRVRYTVMSIHHLNYSRECVRLAEILKQYNLNSNTDSLFYQ